jgi:hypothetical protein
MRLQRIVRHNIRAERIRARKHRGNLTLSLCPCPVLPSSADSLRKPLFFGDFSPPHCSIPPYPANIAPKKQKTVPRQDPSLCPCEQNRQTGSSRVLVTLRYSVAGSVLPFGCPREPSRGAASLARLARQNPLFCLFTLGASLLRQSLQG